MGVFSSDTRLGSNISLDEIDDFVVRPFHPEELHFRIQQAITKLKGNPAQFITRVGDLTIDTERYEVSVSGRRVILTFKEYQLLLLMASTPGRVYKRDVLLNQIWGYDYFGGTRTVDVHIRRIRAKIEDSNHTFIETIRNVGYRFKP
jgi:DNA-binding response OmpR family regulator